MGIAASPVARQAQRDCEAQGQAMRRPELKKTDKPKSSRTKKSAEPDDRQGLRTVSPESGSMDSTEAPPSPSRSAKPKLRAVHGSDDAESEDDADRKLSKADVR